MHTQGDSGLTLGTGTIDVSGTLTDAGALLAGSTTGSVIVESAGLVSVAGGTAGSTIAYAGTGGTVVFASGVAATLTSGLTDPISNFGPGDGLDLSGLAVSGVSAVQVSGTAVTVVNASGATLASLTVSGAFSQLAFAPDLGGGTELVACYAAGTRILTTAGERAIETLAAGDRVISPRGPCVVPVRWIGRRHIDLRLPATEASRPIRVLTGAFGDGLPHRDLLLSPEHAVFVDGDLVPIRCLVNHASIRRCDEMDAVTYCHIELPRHDVVFAEGLPAESWLDTGNRAMFANAPPVPAHPAFAVRPTPCAPLVEHGPKLVALRAMLADRARTMGMALPAEAHLALHEGRCHGVLPAGVGLVRLVSESEVAAGDRRRLGALLRGVAVADVQVTLDGAGWSGVHAVERHDGVPVRWTDGDAVLEVPPSATARQIVVDVARCAASRASLAA